MRKFEAFVHPFDSAPGDKELGLAVVEFFTNNIIVLWRINFRKNKCHMETPDIIKILAITCW